jgi:hypothetical protein
VEEAAAEEEEGDPSHALMSPSGRAPCRFHVPTKTRRLRRLTMLSMSDGVCTSGGGEGALAGGVGAGADAGAFSGGGKTVGGAGEALGVGCCELLGVTPLLESGCWGSGGLGVTSHDAGGLAPRDAAGAGASPSATGSGATFALRDRCMAASKETGAAAGRLSGVFPRAFAKRKRCPSRAKPRVMAFRKGAFHSVDL